MTSQSPHTPMRGQDILALLSSGIPEEQWTNQDDLCNCTFQRTGDWANPYLGRTQRVRICCLFAELYDQYPQFIQEIPAYRDENTGEWESKPREWDGEDDMPEAIWHRQLAVKTGMPLEDIREVYEGQSPPKGTPRERVMSQQQVELNPWELYAKKSLENEHLEQGLNSAIDVIRALKAGDLDIERIEIVDGGFSVLPEGESNGD